MLASRHNETVVVSDTIGSVSVEAVVPAQMQAMIVLAHGAGAGMHHSFMTKLSEALAAASIGTLRYNFPYMENGRKRPDLPAIAHKAVDRALHYAHERYPEVLLVAGGKSFGGRMTSQFVSKEAPPFLRGLVFYGFPLHPAGSPSVERAEHLREVKLPMLFLQGTKDTLAELSLIQSVCDQLSSASLVLFEGADHSFKVSRKEIIPELVQATAGWLKRIGI